MDFSGITQIDLVLIPILGGEHGVFLDELAKLLTLGLTWIPFFISLLIVIIRNNDSMKQIGVILLCVMVSLILSDGMSDGLVKPLAARLRPLNDPVTSSLITLVPGKFAKSFSFFSAHAANTFGLCVFLSLLFRCSYLSFAMVVWSLVNCWTRIYLGMHYPSDIAVGLLWGFCSGSSAYLLYRYLCRRMSGKLKFISSHYTSTGYSIADLYCIVNVLILTVMTAIIVAMI